MAIPIETKSEHFGISQLVRVQVSQKGKHTCSQQNFWCLRCSFCSWIGTYTSLLLSYVKNALSSGIKGNYLFLTIRGLEVKYGVPFQ